jgi:hypothetical protein
VELLRTACNSASVVVYKAGFNRLEFAENRNSQRRCRGCFPQKNFNKIFGSACDVWRSPFMGLYELGFTYLLTYSMEKGPS